MNGRRGSKGERGREKRSIDLPPCFLCVHLVPVFLLFMEMRVLWRGYLVKNDPVSVSMGEHMCNVYVWWVSRCDAWVYVWWVTKVMRECMCDEWVGVMHEYVWWVSVCVVSMCDEWVYVWWVCVMSAWQGVMRECECMCDECMTRCDAWVWVWVRVMSEYRCDAWVWWWVSMCDVWVCVMSD